MILPEESVCWGGLKIYPLYKFTVEEMNADGQIELFEGQTEILPNKYIFVESVKQ